jgi:prophage maintenance system killer protein
MTETRLLIFESDDKSVTLEVTMDLTENTVWLSQKQLSVLFDKDPRSINEHILNIYRENELIEEATIRKFQIVQKEGSRAVKREIFQYNLDVIISVGYRIKSKRGTQFRQWATKQLKSYLLEGYILNKRRLTELDMEIKTMKTGIQILSRTLKNYIKTDDDVKSINILLDQFDKGLSLLDDYDHESLDENGLHMQTAINISEQDYHKLINIMRADFSSKIFGQEKDTGFKSAISQIYQSFDDQDLYPSIEEKAATLLYLIVKNHAFVDGNKRIAAACFVYFLQKNNLNAEAIISSDALATVTLFIAASKPIEMKQVVRLIISLLNRK